MIDNIMKPEFKVNNPPESRLVQEIKNTIYSFEGQMSIASALGCIEIAKFDIEMELLE
jgi:hypothetical protein